MTIFIYARCSDPKQVAKGRSIPDQIARCTEYANRKWPGAQQVIIEEPGISASKKSFLKRRGGVIVGGKASDGDHVVIDKLDRFCRNVKDFTESYAYLDSRGVGVHFLDFGGSQVDSTTPLGKCFMHIGAAFAEMESAMISQRTRAANHQLRKKGRRTGPKPMRGMANVKVGSDTKSEVYIDWCPWARRFIDIVLCLREQYGMGFTDIAKILEKHRRQTNLSKYPKQLRKPWSKLRVLLWYKSASIYAYAESLGITSPREISLQIHKWFDETRCAKRDVQYIYHLVPSHIRLEPKATINDMPEWIKELLSDDIKTLDPVIFRKLGTYDRWLNAKRRARLG